MRTLVRYAVFALFALATSFTVGCAARAVPPMAPAHSRIDLAEHRALEIQRLRDYRNRGVYPLDEQGMPLSAFRDAQGRPCPMAALIEQSGHRMLVDWVVETDNKLRLADVHGGPVYDWMLSSGLTQEEIALVQGVMNIYEIDNLQLSPENPQEATQQWARQEVGRMIDAVLVTLERQTPTSLDVAAARLRESEEPRVAVRSR